MPDHLTETWCKNIGSMREGLHQKPYATGTSEWVQALMYMRQCHGTSSLEWGIGKFHYGHGHRNYPSRNTASQGTWPDIFECHLTPPTLSSKSKFSLQLICSQGRASDSLGANPLMVLHEFMHKTDEDCGELSLIQSLQRFWRIDLPFACQALEVSMIGATPSAYPLTSLH